jgi:SAM-dependent methyltransferase
MVAVAARRNAAAVAAGHIRVVGGDGTALPVDDDTLDGALSVHSVYFWPDPVAVLTGIRRALRPGGRLVLALRPGRPSAAGPVRPHDLPGAHQQRADRVAARGRVHRHPDRAAAVTDDGRLAHRHLTTADAFAIAVVQVTSARVAR